LVKKLFIVDEIQRIENFGLSLKLMVDNFEGLRFIAKGSSASDISEKVFNTNYNYEIG